MRLNRPLDRILNSAVKVRALRIFCRGTDEMSGRQMAKAVGVTPKTAHEILQDLLREGVLVMRAAGKTHLFRLNEDRAFVAEVLKPLFVSEEALSERLFEAIGRAVKRSPLRDGIMSIALFGSVQAKTERATSDVDLLVVVKTSEFKKKTEALFGELDQQLSSPWGNLISPYVNTLAEFKSKANKKTGVIPEILKSYQLIYGSRLEKLLR